MAKKDKKSEEQKAHQTTDNDLSENQNPNDEKNKKDAVEKEKIPVKEKEKIEKLKDEADKVKKKPVAKNSEKEDEEDEDSLESTVKKAVEDKSKSPFEILKTFFKELFDISRETDKSNTTDDIKSSINMKGQNAWVLIFSILICSTGLNTSSAAVVIGAMLISPLMGPILGIGLALGINDISLLNKSFQNFMVMVVLSVLTSFLFFSIPLFQNETTEIIARISPTVLDVIIALSGGLALIIAFSRSNKSFNTIAGVAIATALMPPLCTAGFGLAVGNWDYFGGALFLFLINTIFIATATFTIVKFLRFPMKEYANVKKRRNISRAVYTVVALVIIPSVFMFYKLYKKSDFKQKVEATLLQVEYEKGIGIFEIEADYPKKVVSFAVLGKSLLDNDIVAIEEEISKYGYKDVKLKIIQEEDNVNNVNRLKEIEKSYLSTQELLALKDNQISEKEKQLLKLEKAAAKNKSFPFQDIMKELKSIEPNLEQTSYYDVLSTNFKTTDTLKMIKINFNKKINKKEKLISQTRITNWLHQRVKTDSIEIVFE